MTTVVRGRFEVQMTPMKPLSENETSFPGRMLLKKTYSGELQATSAGQMLAHMTSTPKSAGYVALEQLQGTLNGRKGTFVLQHFGLMNRGAEQLIVSVVPDSGTEELLGLSGKLQIEVEEGKHFYVFEYQLST